ncbi:FAD-dependent oxidoreductase [Shewanella sp. SR43-4]|uniref:FAD-dependent oxidoreductase n=1 Tax=Shewanella vesiculosa TaxID=518738 RepID=A0ABV0FP28_9GAMM|nr:MULTISPECIES: FAD-dependent oxidoreductase [unclassified Shewanella]MBB1319711.1 FAD-dependent oxidoreductase [Shewanella sp. SR43-4]MBB1321218.1 FAD-dependent oxidoreductase [Shewanella sp. SR43-8]MBB1390273.1 FAD-dependent oxidoreductase [Shewanella sp. SG44-6]MBB1474138.1 FAD-dependent oxidoreductase [Shewanella sp. SG41-3]|tara:strand:+ start:1671 stop:2939 length:1269 start_codon:yes stop_codon:yes gene_type:complete
MKNIAVIGSGIAGLTSAHLLSREHTVTVFEANDYIGGHTATIDVEVAGQQYAIDSGFIVFNDRTYPLFETLMAQLKIKSIPTEMSFSVNNALTGLEYNGHNLWSLFAQRRNLFRPSFYKFLGEIVRFNNGCKVIYEADKYPTASLGEYLDQQGFSAFFCEHYILPMGAAIWSASIDDMRGFSLRFFIRFFQHHGLLNINDRPQWYVLEGGSRSYIPALTAPFKDRIQLNSPVTGIKRSDDGVYVQVAKGEWQRFDDVVLSCHSDQALAMLTDATQDEIDVLGAMEYQNNEVVLHTDINLLPKRKAAWASWNYRLDGKNQQDIAQRPASVTYNMNILQCLPASAPTFCVTLNQTALIDERKILRKFNYAHPVFNDASMKSQAKRSLINGKHNTYFAGAYWHNGFHEDGVRSAVEVCDLFGISL